MQVSIFIFYSFPLSFFIFLLSNNAAGNYRLFKQRERIRQWRLSSSVNHNSEVKKIIYEKEDDDDEACNYTTKGGVWRKRLDITLAYIHVCHYYIDDYAFFVCLCFCFVAQHLNSNELWHWSHTDWYGMVVTVWCSLKRRKRGGETEKNREEVETSE